MWPGTFHSTVLPTKCLVSNTENLFGLIEAPPEKSIHILSVFLYLTYLHFV